MQYPALLMLLVGCGFQGQNGQPGGGGGDGDPIDAAVDASIDGAIDAAIDAPVDAADVLIDAAIDAPPMPSITNHPSVADTFMASDLPNSIFDGMGSALTDGGSTPRSVLIRFDLSSLPVTTTVTGAQLFIWTDYDPGQTVMMYPVLQAWTESSATWNSRSSGVAWAAAGASPPTSRSATVAGMVTPTQAFTGYVVTISAAVVQGWVTTPGTNHGLVITTANMDGTRFATRENATAGMRPYLSVTHVP